MARTFNIIELSGERLSVAFPLVSAALPDVALANWRAFVAPFAAGAGPAGGVLGTVGEGGYLCGLLVYRLDRDLRHGAVLEIDLFIAVDLVDRAAAIRGLIGASEAKASELGCRLVRIRLGADHLGIAADLGRSGYQPDAQLLAKPLDSARPVN
jgi:hypothetical protein